jgi:hypothetical protein
VDEDPLRVQASPAVDELAGLAEPAREALILTEVPFGIDRARALLAQVDRRLAQLAADPELPGDVHARVVDLRDRVGAHLLAADNLDEAGAQKGGRDLVARAARMVFESSDVCA